MEQKYKINYDTSKKLDDGTMVYQIEALQDFCVSSNGEVVEITKGELGGWVDSEYCLSQEGNCWIFPDSIAYEGATVLDSAAIRKTLIKGSLIENSADCYDCTVTNSVIKGRATCGYSTISESTLYGNVLVVCSEIKNLVFSGAARVSVARVTDMSTDIIAVKPIGSRKDEATFYRAANNGIRVSTGCFNDSIEEFERAVKETHGDNEFAAQYNLAIKLAKLRIWGMDYAEE